MGPRKRHRDSSSSSSSESNTSDSEVKKGRSHYSKKHKRHDSRHSSRELTFLREKSPRPSQRKRTKCNDYDDDHYFQHRSRKDNRDDYSLSKKHGCGTHGSHSHHASSSPEMQCL